MGVGAGGWVFSGQWKFFPAVPCGVVMIALAAACGLAGASSLGRNLTPFPKPRQETRLVQSGIYRWMRHPLYTAVVSAAVGWVLVRQSVPALLATAALGLFFDAKARREEKWLREKFPEYSDYSRRVRRFVPFVY